MSSNTDLSPSSVAALVDSLRENLVVHVLTAPDPDTAREAIDNALAAHAAALDATVTRAERFAFAGQLSTGVAHELRNPLAVIETSVFILRERVGDDPGVARQLARITEQVSAANAIVGELLDAVRDRPIERRTVDLADVAREAIDRVPRPTLVTLRRELLHGVAMVDGDARRLCQVAVNLLTNAVQAMGDQPGVLTVRVMRDEAYARLVVEDDGPGIDDALLPRLFDPLVTGRTEGTGLGLALSRRIAALHGATLTAENASPRGARFVLSIPAQGA